MINYLRYWMARFVGLVLRYVFGLTCGFLEDSQYFNRPCVLTPGHSGLCQSKWDRSKTKPFRYTWKRRDAAVGGIVTEVHCEIGE